MNLAESARRYAHIKRRRALLRRIDERLSKREEKAEELLLELMIEDGIDQVKVDKTTFYIRSEQWGKLVVPDGGNKDEYKLAAVRALMEMGHESMINYNAQSLRAVLVQAADPETGELPPELAAHFALTSKPAIGVLGNRKRK